MKVSESLLKIAQYRGVDTCLLEPFDYKSRLQEIRYRKNKISKTLTIKQQLKMIDITLNETLQPNYVMCIGTDVDGEKAQKLAAQLFLSALDEYNKMHDPKFDAPLWHYVTGNYQDSLRDQRQKYRIPNLLVLDGLAINSTDAKVEKARDIIELHRRIPRIITIAGSCPLAFVYERLRIPVNRAIYFGISTTEL